MGLVCHAEALGCLGLGFRGLGFCQLDRRPRPSAWGFYLGRHLSITYSL